MTIFARTGALTIIALVLATNLGIAKQPPESSPQPPATGGAQASAATFDAVFAILDEHCNGCHSGARPPRGANFETLEGVLAERPDRPPLVVPGDPEASELLRRVIGSSEPRMPLDGPPWLTDAQVETIRSWIASLSKTPASMPTAPEITTQPSPASQPEPAKSPATATPSPKREYLPANVALTYADVRPILAANCMRCHVEGGERGPAPEGLVLTSLESVLRSSERPVVIPGNAAASLMIRHIVGAEKPRMPFDGPPWVPNDDVQTLVRWINDGARDEQGKASPVPVGREVRLEGTLTAQWVVDGVPFRVQSGARVRDVRVGRHVEVRATIQSDGSLLATRVRGR
jgi:mono/diheme cytochrome c family protein